MSFQVLDDIRAERARQNMSNVELAERSGASEPTVSKLISGKADNPTLTTVVDMADALGLEVRAVPVGALDQLPTEKAADVGLYDRIIAEKARYIIKQDKIIETQKKYIYVLFSILMLLVFIFVAFRILDRISVNWSDVEAAARSVYGAVVNRTAVRIL